MHGGKGFQKAEGNVMAKFKCRGGDPGQNDQRQEEKGYKETSHLINGKQKIYKYIIKIIYYI